MKTFRLIGYDENGNKHKQTKCCYCNCFLTAKTSTRDHLYPRSKGGNITKRCCVECNQEKKNLTLSEYITLLFKKEPNRLNNLKISNAIKLRQYMYSIGLSS